VLEYRLGLLDGATVAAAIKQVRPEIPIVMLADDLELPDGALKSVDALVVKSDGVHFLLATVHFILNVKPAQREEEQLRGKTPLHVRRLGRSRGGAEHGAEHSSPKPVQSAAAQPAPADHDVDREERLSPEAWRRIRNGNIQF
jgi:hypothetical protein